MNYRTGDEGRLIFCGCVVAASFIGFLVAIGFFGTAATIFCAITFLFLQGR